MKTKKITLLAAGIFTLLQLAVPVTSYADFHRSAFGEDSDANKAGKASCVTKTLSTYKNNLSKVQSAGLKQIDKRTQSLNQYEKKIKKVFSKSTFRAQLVLQNKENAKYNKNLYFSSLPVTPYNSEGDLKYTVDEFSSRFQTDRGLVSSAPSAEVASEAMCDAIWSTHLYTYLPQKISSASKLDNLANKNGLNVARYEFIRDAIGNNKLPDSVTLPKSYSPEEIEDQISTSGVALFNIHSNSFTDQDFLTVNKSFRYLGAKVNSQTHPIKKAYSTAKRSLK